MTLTNYLKEQLLDFVDSYKKYFSQTLYITLILSLVCFAGAVFLLRFSEYDDHTMAKQISILSYFFHRYSNKDSYCLVDLTKTFFVFFVALFSVGLIRQTNGEAENKELKSFQFFNKLYFRDVLLLTAVLFFASALDYAFSSLESYSTTLTISKATGSYIGTLMFHLRIYVPLFLFALSIRYLTNPGKTTLTLKNILFLYISLWLFNEFAFEISVWVRYHLFNLILLPIEDPNKFYLYESILGIPLIAFFFLGYHSAMKIPLKLTERQ